MLLALLTANVAGLWALILQLIRQRGRLLLRLDDLEQALAAAGVESFPLNGFEPDSLGAPVGSRFPSFALPDLDGNRVALDDYRGRRVLIVNWNPDCSFCDQLAPQLAKVQDKLHSRKTELLLVARGDAEANRSFAEEHGLRCPVLIRSAEEGIEPLDRLGTPAAYLLDGQARVLEPLAFGAPDVGELAGRAAGRTRLRTERPLSESRIVRDGIKPGTPAPPFTLSGVGAGNLSLEDYRGRRVLLVFSDTHCGPCDELMPELVKLHRRAPDDDPAILLVSRGELEENRRKVESHGIEFPVGIQPLWRVSREYGIFLTPVGFLVNERGLIAREVAKGPEEIVALYEAELASRKEAPSKPEPV